MRSNITQGLQVLRRTSAFLEKEVNIPVKMGPISKHVAAFNAVVDRLETLAAEQHASDRGFQDASQKARDLAKGIVREYVRPLSRLGKVLYPTESPVRATLKLPKHGAVSYGALIAAVEGVADRLEEHKAKFIEAGFGEDFVQKLRGAVAELRAALEEKAAHYGRRSKATSGQVLAYGQAREMVRMLDAMVAPRLEGTEQLAEWKTLSRFARDQKREEEEQGDGSPPVASPTVPSTPAEGVASSTVEVSRA